MRIGSRIDSFVRYFREFLDQVIIVPDEPRLSTLKKLGFMAIIDALSKVGAHTISANRPRFVSFIQQFSDWADGERISLPNLVYALSRDTQQKFQQLKEFADARLQSWPSRGSPPSPYPIDRDPLPEELRDLWPQEGTVLGMRCESFCHVHLLYSYRNILAHELRTTAFTALEANYPFAYYSRMRIYDTDNVNGRETWHLHYPLKFLSTRASTCLEKLEEWLKAENIDPYDHYRISEFMLKELA